MSRVSVEGGSEYFGLDRLDERLARHLSQSVGTFVELGAFDGVTQSNTLYFERRGWRGVLIEPVPSAYERCRRNRPLAQVIQCACVGPHRAGQELALVDVGLMSMVNGAMAGDKAESWLARAEEVQQITRRTVMVPTCTLQNVLDQCAVRKVDLLSLDVEGMEVEVLSGLDLQRCRPEFILAEDAYNREVGEFLFRNGYGVVAVLSERRYTRDVLYRNRGLAC